MLDISLEWLSRGCNRAGAALRGAGYGEESFKVRYGAGANVVEWEARRCGADHRSDMKVLGLVRDAKVDKGQITAVAVVLDKGLTLTGSSTGIFNTLRDNEVLQTISLGNDAAVSSIRLIDSITQNLCVVSSQAGTVYLYRLTEEATWDEFSRWQLPANFLPNATAALRLGPDLLVFVGGTDQYIYAYSVVEETGEFSLSAKIVGHRDWVRALDIYVEQDGDEGFWLASGSNDTTVRIWKIVEASPSSETVDDFLGAPRKQIQLGGGRTFVARTETIISDHSEKVTDVRWHTKYPCLVIASMDASITVWSPSEEATWLMQGRFGLFGGLGAHATGFFGASFVNDSPSVVAQSPTGALYFWSSESSLDETTFAYESASAPAGHSTVVTDMCWDPEEGSRLLTCSEDKTTRIYSQSPEHSTWKEVCRPQVHGHPLYTAVFVSGAQSFVSGGEEKMLRVFQAPKKQAAVLPALGLSNRVMDNVDNKAEVEASSQCSEDGADGGTTEYAADGNTPISIFGAIKTESPGSPVEEDLMQSYLWPEQAKLYGHGNEVSCVAASPATDVDDHIHLASACRSQSAKHSSIIIWDCSRWTELYRLDAHELTVSQLSFSRNRKGLLSVSRDRSFAVFTQAIEDGRFHLRQRARPHARQIHCGAWSGRDTFFATGSRDKTLRLFQGFRPDGGVPESFGSPLEGPGAVVKFVAGVSAIEFTDISKEDSDIAVAGLEDGSIQLLRWTRTKHNALQKPNCLWTSSICHVGRVRRLRWQPGPHSRVRFASCGDDGSVRIYVGPERLALSI